MHVSFSLSLGWNWVVKSNLFVPKHLYISVISVDGWNLHLVNTRSFFDLFVPIIWRLVIGLGEWLDFALIFTCNVLGQYQRSGEDRMKKTIVREGLQGMSEEENI